MISVERGIEYTDLEKEAPWEYEYRPPPWWPHSGEIDFNNMNFRYSLDELLVYCAVFLLHVLQIFFSLIYVI